ncbi:MAG: class II fructose-bisphosphate aldolase, partial [Planctomycetaceae bacterium]
TRPIVDFMLKHYDEVLMVDGEIGSKKSYDPRTYLKLGEAGVAKRLHRACDELKSSGKTLCGS